MINLKKVAITLVFILLLATGITIISFATSTGIVTEEAKLRKTTSNDSTILEIIPKQEEVEILEDAGDYYKVDYKKIKGYVEKQYIKTEEDSTNTNTTQENNTVNNNTQENEQATNENEEDIYEILKEGSIAVTTDDITVYVRPLVNSKAITNIEHDKDVTIISIMNNWAYISTDNTNGWVILDLLGAKQEENKEEEKPKEPEQPKILNKTGYVAVSEINFRKKPDTSSKVLKILNENDKITIISEEGDWYKAKYDGTEGYIAKKYVSDKKVKTSSRGGIDRTKKEDTKTETSKETQSTSKEESKTSSSKGQEVANYAKQFLGSRYVYGGSSTKGFDCSGLTMYVYKKFGVNLPHSSSAQSNSGTKVSRQNLQPGDLVFFRNYSTNKGIGHVGIYVGNNKFVHASTEKTGVITSSLSGTHSSRYVTAVRLFNN